MATTSERELIHAEQERIFMAESGLGGCTSAAASSPEYGGQQLGEAVRRATEDLARERRGVRGLLRGAGGLRGVPAGRKTRQLDAPRPAHGPFIRAP